ncbi:CGNR zinc finger domain-containing protein [Actinopolymorpha pittospori]|uniref:CGNR zinc finger domain-containing protein n=1 Tax=Actinopolymorpha pittospori TaxID=648752 RepID=UPI002353A6ED|nr:ABATE domain-containing protein [Actinopolymorpha pittospori]
MRQPALDFVGTLQARRNPEPTEVLVSPRSLGAWFRESGLVDVEPRASAADLDAAITLREAIYALVLARMGKRGYDDDALALVNHAADAPPVIPRLAHDGRRAEATAPQAMSSVARDAIGILGGPQAAHLKECGRPECTQVYLDHSRSGRREWCAMATCGNRMKAAAYRARKRSSVPSAT